MFDGTGLHATGFLLEMPQNTTQKKDKRAEENQHLESRCSSPKSQKQTAVSVVKEQTKEMAASLLAASYAYHSVQTKLNPALIRNSLDNPFFTGCWKVFAIPLG